MGSQKQMRQMVMASFGVGILAGALSVLLLTFTPFAGVVEAQTAEEGQSEDGLCVVSENFIELTSENSFTMLKLLSMINSQRSLLDDSNNFGTYYMTLLSTRRYHEEIHDRLPECAQPLNRAYIQTITATQDALAINLAGQTHPEQIRYVNRLEQARENLSAEWAALSSISSQTGLTSDLQE